MLLGGTSCKIHWELEEHMNNLIKRPMGNTLETWWEHQI